MFKMRLSVKALVTEESFLDFYLRWNEKKEVDLEGIR
jgi:hypothetical protein